MRKEIESLLCVAFDNGGTGSDDKSFYGNVTMSLLHYG